MFDWVSPCSTYPHPLIVEFVVLTVFFLGMCIWNVWLDSRLYSRGQNAQIQELFDLCFLFWGLFVSPPLGWFLSCQHQHCVTILLSSTKLRKASSYYKCKQTEPSPYRPQVGTMLCIEDLQLNCKECVKRKV